MLQVNVDSWHYRLRAKTFDSTPKDLCSYFWSTVASALAIFLYAFGRGVARVVRPLGRFAPAAEWLIPKLIVLAGVGLVGFFLVYLGYLLWTRPVDFLLVVLVIIGVTAGIALIIGAIVGLVHLNKRYRSTHPKLAPTRKTAPKKPKKPKKVKEGDSTARILWTFLMSKKRKVCPLIEVVGEDDEQSGLELVR